MEASRPVLNGVRLIHADIVGNPPVASRLLQVEGTSHCPVEFAHARLTESLVTVPSYGIGHERGLFLSSGDENGIRKATLEASPRT